MREAEAYLERRRRTALQEPLCPQAPQMPYQIIDVLKATPDKASFLATCDGGRTRCVVKKARRGLDVEYDFMARHAHSLRGVVPSPVAYWEEDGWQYLTRQYVPGQTLGELYRAQAPIDKKTVRRIARALGSALERLHALGFVHRDLKPENVLWTDEGLCVLIDIETVRSPSPEKSVDTVSLGTPAYASPEQLCDRQTSARSDVYGFGRILLFLLTGSDDEADAKALKGRMGRIVRRCVAFAPEKRYASVKAAREAVHGRRFLKAGLVCLALCALLAVAGALLSRSVVWVGGRPLQQALDNVAPGRSATLILTRDLSLDGPLRVESRSVALVGRATVRGEHDGNATVRVLPGASLRLGDGVTLATERTGTVVDNHGTFVLDGGAIRVSGATQGLVGVFNDHATLELLRGSVEVDSALLPPDGYTLCVHDLRGATRIENARLLNVNCPAKGGALLEQGGHCTINGGTIFVESRDNAPVYSAAAIEDGVIRITGGECDPEAALP